MDKFKDPIINKDGQSFFSGQGNQHDGPSYSKGIVIGITLFLLTLIGIFKKQIKSFFKRKEERVGDTRLQILGALLFTFQVFKLILYCIGDYPLYGDLLGLHICRIHMILISMFLMFRKKELIKYLVYISTMGAFFAMGFGTQTGSAISGKLKEQIFTQNGFTFYHVGIDNFFFGDFFAFHISIVIIPIVLGTGFGGKLKTAYLYRSSIVYVLGITLIGTLNIITSQSSDIRGGSNNGYIGEDKANDYSNALGVLSAGPQNLFAYLAIGIITMHLFHYVGIIQSQDRKMLGKEYKAGYKNILANIFKSK